jgi:hypothetical protein
MTVALITIHGMGITERTYAGPLLAGLRAHMGALYAKVAPQSVYYQHILQANEQTVWDRVDRDSKVHYDDLRKFLLFGFGDAAGLESRKEDPDSVYELAQMEVAKSLLAAYRKGCAATPPEPAVPVVFISQSLGCQVLSNYLYDAQQAAAGVVPVRAGIWKDIQRSAKVFAGGVLSAAEIKFLAGGTCVGWITTGCNIPIFVAAHKTMDIVPIAAPTQLFKWLNIYDPDDVLGWPLQPLSPGYQALVEDRPINAGQGALNWILKSWNPLAHTAYWTDDEVIAPLARMLGQTIG